MATPQGATCAEEGGWTSMAEEWRPSPSFPGCEISDLGRARRSGRLLEPLLYRRGYCVAINHPRHQAVRVSTLVAGAFLGLTALGTGGIGAAAGMGGTP